MEPMTNTFTDNLNAICPECGQPMSLVNDTYVTETPYWYCDGPNDRTAEDGCGHTEAKAFFA